MNYKDFLQPTIDKEKEKLKSDLNYYKTEYEKLKKENDKLRNDNKILNNALIKANQTISDFNNKPKDNANLNEILNLKNLILTKDNEILNIKNTILSKDTEIMNLKLQLQNNENKKSVNIDDIIFINFSLDENINCGIKCLKTDTFAEVEEKLYQKYPDYRNTNNNFVINGGTVLRFKKISENNINDSDKVQLIKIE